MVNQGGADTGGPGGRIERRREKIRAEVERNRRGDYIVPTWVLVAALVAVVVGWAAVVIMG
jgi:hypothetical protein